MICRPEDESCASPSGRRGADPRGSAWCAPRVVVALLACGVLGLAACGGETGLAPFAPLGPAAPGSTSGVPIVDPGEASRDVTLRWVPSASSGVVRYDLSVGRGAAAYETTVRIPVGATVEDGSGIRSYTIKLRKDIDVYLALRAYDGRRSSQFSNEIRLPAQAGGGGGGSAAVAVADGGGGGEAAQGTAAAPVDPAADAGASGAPAALAGDAASPAASYGADGSRGPSPHAAAGSPALPVADTVDPVHVSPSRDDAVPAEDGGGGEDPAVASDDVHEALASVELDGEGEYLGSAVPGRLGGGGALTLSVWLRPFLDYAPRRVLFEARAMGPSTVRRVTLALLRGEDLELALFDEAGEPVYRGLYEAAPAHDLWQQLVVVVDPTTGLQPRVYLDLIPCTLLGSTWSGATFGIPDTDWQIHLGGAPDAEAPGFVGRIGHAALWDEAVPRSALAVIHARGHEIDLRLPVGAYASEDALGHYWRLGDPDHAIGYDLGRSYAPIDLDDPAGGVDRDDVVPDGPHSIVDAAWVQ